MINSFGMLLKREVALNDTNISCGSIFFLLIFLTNDQLPLMFDAGFLIKLLIISCSNHVVIALLFVVNT